MKRMLVVFISVLLSMTMLLLTSGSVLAFDSKVMNRYSAMEAYANWQQVTSDDFSQLNLRVTRTDDGIFATVTLVTVSGDVKTLLTGSTPVSADDFTIEDDLSAAVLSEISVDLYSGPVPPQPLPKPLEAIAAVQTISISAIWTGTGDLVKNTYRTQTRSGDFSSRSSSTVIYRLAEVTGVLDGSALGATTGQLTEIKATNTYMDK